MHGKVTLSTQTPYMPFQKLQLSSWQTSHGYHSYVWCSFAAVHFKYLLMLGLKPKGTYPNISEYIGTLVTLLGTKYISQNRILNFRVAT